MSDSRLKRRHIVTFMHLEVSTAGCFSMLCTLCFRRFCFLLCPYTDVIACWISLYGHAQACQLPAHKAVPSLLLLCSDTLHLCSLLHRLLKMFEMALIKWGVFWVNEEKLALFSFPKEAKTRQKLLAFLFFVHLYHVDLFTSNMSTWAGLRAKLLLKNRCSLVTRLCWRVRSKSCKWHFISVLAVIILSVMGLWVQLSATEKRGETQRADLSFLKTNRLYCLVSCI